MSIRKSGDKRASSTSKTVSIRLPGVLVAWMDTLVDSGLYNARAEIIREFAREHIERRQQRQQQ